MTGKNKRDVSLLARQTGMEDHGETEECHVMTRQSGRRHHIQQRRERKGKYFRATTIDSLLSVERGGIKKEKKRKRLSIYEFISTFQPTASENPSSSAIFLPFVDCKSGQVRSVFIEIGTAQL